MTELLTDNLPLLAGAPNGIKKLRELILELAVRGKLVAQDPSDEPASELLKRIAKEKVRLVAEGKIKKQKALAEVGEEEKLFELPSGWEWQRLDGISPMSLVDGDWIESKDQDPSGGIRLLQLADIGVNEFKDKSDRFVNAETFKRLNCTALEAGDILIARLPSPIGRACIFPGLSCKAITVVDVAVLRPLSTFCSGYVVNAINSICFREQVEAYGKGATRFRIATGHLKTLLIPMPPLAEQHRIVAKVDELMALCDRLEAQQADAESAHAQLVQALLDSLTQASDATEFAANWQRLAEHFHTLFTTEPSIDALKQTLLQLAVMGKLVPQDPGDEPASALVKRIQAEKQRYLAVSKARKQKDLATDSRPEPPFEALAGWEWQTIDDVLHVTGGVTLGRKLGGRKLLSKPYLRVANVQRGHLEMDHIKEVEVPEDEVEKYLLRSGDLLITEGGDWDKVGRTATWRDELPECLHQNHVFRARAVVSDWEPRWAEMYLNSASAREYFAGSSKQTTNLASINMTQLRACAFPLPPLPEQHRIVAKVDQLMALCDQLKTRLTQARQLNEQLASTLVEQAVA